MHPESKLPGVQTAKRAPYVEDGCRGGRVVHDG